MIAGSGVRRRYAVSRVEEPRGGPVLVYAIVLVEGTPLRRSGRLEGPKTLRSIGGERLRLVRLPAASVRHRGPTSSAAWRRVALRPDGAKAGRGTLAAVVSDRPRASASSANLRRYDRVMCELAARFPAILPARFGTVVEESELMFILSSRRAALGRALTRVRGRVQMTIRVLSRGDAEGRALAKAEEAGGGAVTGRDYLAGKARAGRAVAGFEPVRAAVSRWVRDERVERRGGVSSVYHLIPRSSTVAYQHAVQAASASTGLRLIVSGPWPPYAFAD